MSDLPEPHMGTGLHSSMILFEKYRYPRLILCRLIPDHTHSTYP